MNPRGLLRHPTYTPIPQADVSQPARDSEIQAGTMNRLIHSAGTWAVWVALICTVADLLAILFITILYSSTKDVASIPFDDVPFQSSYINLEDLYKHKKYSSVAHDAIINLPRTLIAVNSSDPTGVMPEWPEFWTTSDGNVLTYKRQFLVTPEISMIAQFHVMDFGMENCSVTFTTPPEASSMPSLDGSLELTVLDVWLLSADHSLSLRDVSWDTRPPRSNHIGRFSVSPGATQQLPGFACQAGTFQTIEISCRTPRCYVDALIEKKPIGVYLTQYQTV